MSTRRSVEALINAVERLSVTFTEKTADIEAQLQGSTKGIHAGLADMHRAINVEFGAIGRMLQDLREEGAAEDDVRALDSRMRVVEERLGIGDGKPH